MSDAEKGEPRMGRYAEEDAARDTYATEREVAEAWHSARDDSGRSGTGYDGGLSDNDWRSEADNELQGVVEGIVSGADDGK